MYHANKMKHGFALIEVLIAMTVFSFIILSVYSGISASINSIKDAKNYSTAMMIAKTKLNEFKMNNMRGPDFYEEPVNGYDSFLCSKTTSNFEHALLGLTEAKRTEITVQWGKNGKEQKYAVSFIYMPR